MGAWSRNAISVRVERTRWAVGAGGVASGVGDGVRAAGWGRRGVEGGEGGLAWAMAQKGQEGWWDGGGIGGLVVGTVFLAGGN